MEYVIINLNGEKLSAMVERREHDAKFFWLNDDGTINPANADVLPLEALLDCVPMYKMTLHADHDISAAGMYADVYRETLGEILPLADVFKHNGMRVTLTRPCVRTRFNL